MKDIPRRIEAFDISHLQGTDTVASMVVFMDGVPNRDEYRRFSMRLKGNNDVGHMREVISRRFSAKNLESWPKPDLILIDGGKPQLGGALAIMDQLGISVPAVGLAKREEELIRRRPDSTPIEPGHYDDEAWIESNLSWETMLLPPSSHVLHLLQRVRDEAHRFAITYQGLLRGKRQIKSILDDIPGIGPAARKQLIAAFGSGRGVKMASQDEISKVVGAKKAQSIREHLGMIPVVEAEPNMGSVLAEDSLEID